MGDMGGMEIMQRQCSGVEKEGNRKRLPYACFWIISFSVLVVILGNVSSIYIVKSARQLIFNYYVIQLEQINIKNLFYFIVCII